VIVNQPVAEKTVAVPQSVTPLPPSPLPLERPPTYIVIDKSAPSLDFDLLRSVLSGLGYGAGRGLTSEVGLPSSWTLPGMNISIPEFPTIPEWPRLPTTIGGRDKESETGGWGAGGGAPMLRRGRDKGKKKKKKIERGDRNVRDAKSRLLTEKKIGSSSVSQSTGGPDARKV
jgi:hypothetical protein